MAVISSNVETFGVGGASTERGAAQHLRAGAFVLCAAVLSTRAWGRLLHPQLWAEDGREFVTEAFRFGLASVWRPYSGYLHVVPRAVALAGTVVRLNALPLFVCAIALAIAAWCFSLVADERCANLLADARLRLLLAVALCFSPGSHEVLGNLANLHALGMLWLGVLAARQPGTPLRGSERAALPLMAFTAAEAAVLLPVFAVRSVAPSCRRARFDERWCALMLASAALAHVLLSPGGSAGGETAAVSPVAALVHAEISGIVLGPLLGRDGLALAWGASSRLTLVCAGLAGLGLLWAAWRSRSASLWPLALSAVCWASLPALTLIVRPGAELAYGVRPHDGYAWARYAFQLAPAGLVVWVALLARWPFSRSPWPAVIVLLVGIALAPPRWKIRAWDAPRWADALERARADPHDGCAAPARSDEVRVATAPQGWEVALPRHRVCDGR